MCDRTLKGEIRSPQSQPFGASGSASLAEARLSARLQADMPAEVVMAGDERTPLEDLFEPITQALRQGARER